MAKTKFRYFVIIISVATFLILFTLGLVSILHMLSFYDQVDKKLLLEIISLVITSIALYSIMVALYSVLTFKKESTQNEFINEMESLASIYLCMHKLSIENNKIQEYYCEDFIKPHYARPFPKIKEVVYYVVKQISTESDFEMMKSFIDFDTLASRLLGQKEITYEFRSKTKGWCRAMFIRIAGYEATEHVIFAIEAINEEKEKENKLQYLSETDLMTNLKNRGSGEKAIRDCLEKKIKGTLLLMDVDKFKRFNDTYGHAAGDEVIIAVAKTLKTVFNTDIVMRLGGDEFAVYLKNTTEDLDVKQKIFVLFNAIDNIHLLSINNSPIKISLGAAVYNGETYQNFEALYHNADEGTYKSKTIEGNAYTIIK